MRSEEVLVRRVYRDLHVLLVAQLAVGALLARAAFEHDDVLDVVGMGEHIDRLDFAYGVAVLREEFYVTYLGCGIAGNVDDASRQKGTGRPQKRFART